MIGILGGTFDPIHLGHTHIANEVVSRLGLAQLHFMPCALPVHRGSPHASAAQRCEMIELAIADQPVFALNRIELQRDEPSYTVDSLRRMRASELFAGEDRGLALVLGADAFNGFDSWKSPRQVLELAHLVICARPGFAVNDELYREHRVDSPADLQKRPAGAILLLAIDEIDCSASQIRQALQQGLAVRQYLSPAVADYIDEHNLYRNSRD